MDKIVSFEDFTLAVKDFQKSNPKGFTNCFLMPDEIKSLIGSGSIYVSRQKNWLFIICERSDYYNLYFYSSSSPCIPDVKEFADTFSKKQIFVDVVVREGASKENEAINVLFNAGIISSYKNYKRMSFSGKSEDEAVFFDENFYKTVSEYKSCEDIFSLWKTALDEKSTPLPDKKDVLALEKDGNILYIVDVDGFLCAVGMLNVQGRNALIQHIAVSNDHRRKGLAKYLVSRLIDLSVEKEVRTLKLWVDCNNTPAVKLYDRIGFINDGMMCKQFEMKGF